MVGPGNDILAELLVFQLSENKMSTSTNAILLFDMTCPNINNL